ncbi:MAG: hypothetical protein VX640_04975 [Pseudomonadota bacterium]|nr:hypothetical protein [Pseudomonadota bacterium]
MSRLEELIGPEEPKGARAALARTFAAASARARTIFAGLRRPAPVRPAEPPAPDHPSFAAAEPAGARSGAPDPAKLFFPSERGFAGDGSARPDTSLGFELSRSANDIVGRQVSLSEKAGALSSAIAERLDGETSLITQGFRIIIAMMWAFFAITLLWISRGGAAPWAAWMGAVAPGDAAILARAFTIIAAAGLAVPFVVGLVVWALGKSDNNALRAKSAELGREAGALALDFDAELDRLRRDMDARKENPAAAVIELSRAHLTALEAAVFFRRLQFLTEPDRYEASLKFRGFLRGTAAPAGKFEAFLLGLLTGVFAYGMIAPTPIQIPIDLPAGFLESYPWAVTSILVGAFFFAIVGLVVSLMRGVLTAPAERQARSEALDAVRSGFVGMNAPSIESLIRRIEDALDVYQARLSGFRPSGAHAADAAAETPAWRKPPEGPRFVDTGFAAAPKAFLAGPAPAGGRKKRKRFLPSPIPGAD